jgi:hypothetical protein
VRRLAGAGRDTHITSGRMGFRTCESPPGAGKTCRNRRSPQIAIFGQLKRLTVRVGRDYIAALGRTAALARWRVREAPHCLRGESSGQKLWPWRMYGRRRLRFLPGGCRGLGFRRNRKVSGCLTSESEERETWTAESLRAASSNGRSFGFIRKRCGHWKRLWRSTFKVTLLEFVELRLCERQEWDLVKRVISRDQSHPT